MFENGEFPVSRWLVMIVECLINVEGGVCASQVLGVKHVNECWNWQAMCFVIEVGCGSDGYCACGGA